MEQKHREELSWIQGAIIGITAGLGEADKEKKDLLRSVARAIESMLHVEEEEDDEAQSD